MKIDNNEFLEAFRKLAHMLSQPLTSLRGSVEVALMGEVDESECRQVLELVLQDSHSITEILGALRDIIDSESHTEDPQALFWTEIVEKALKQTASAGESDGPQMVCDAMADVWVKAGSQWVEIVTRRFLGGVHKASRGKREAHVRLSANGKWACLSICGKNLPQDLGAAGDPEHFSRDQLYGGILDAWIVRRAVERQGGRLNFRRTSESDCCYELNLPLTLPGRPRNA